MDDSNVTLKSIGIVVKTKREKQKTFQKDTDLTQTWYILDTMTIESKLSEQLSYYKSKYTLHNNIHALIDTWLAKIVNVKHMHIDTLIAIYMYNNQYGALNKNTLDNFFLDNREHLARYKVLLFNFIKYHDYLKSTHTI